MEQLRAKEQTKPPTEAVHPETTANSQSTETPKDLPLTTNMKPAPKSKNETHHCKPNDTPPWKTAVEVGTLFIGLFVAYVYYGQLGQMIESNRISHDSLESVQRAFMTFRILGVNRRRDKGIIEFKAIWDNSGNTPAIDVLQFFSTQAINRPPTEAEFQGVHPLPPEASVTPIGPKAPMESETISEQDFLGPMLSKSPGERSDIYTKVGYASWGWVVYRDVFKDTPVHITEFCEQVASIQVPDNPAESPNITLNRCKEHNCEDNYCTDYQSLVDLAKPKQ